MNHRPTIKIAACVVLCAAAVFARVGACRAQNRVDGEPIGWGGGGWFSRVVFHPSDPNVLYCGNDMGGVFKSTDGGTNWQFLSRNLHGQAVKDIAIYPGAAGLSDVIYVQTDRTVEKSLDGGLHWQLLTPRYEYQTSYPTRPMITTLKTVHRRIRTLVIDPSNPNVVYTAGEQGKDSGSVVDYLRSNIYKTEDGGTTWKILQRQVTCDRIDPTKRSQYKYGRVSYPALSYFAGPIRNLYVNPSNKQLLYAAGANGFFVSTDGGANWRQKVNGLPLEPVPDARLRNDASAAADKFLDYDIYDMAVNPLDARVVYVLTRTHGVYKTTDGGDTWTSVTPVAGPIFLTPYNPATYQRDRISDASESSAINSMSLIMDSANPNRLLLSLGNFSCHLYETTDGAATWHPFFGRGKGDPVLAEADEDYPYKDKHRAGPPYHLGYLLGSWSGYATDMAISPTNPDVLFATDSGGLKRFEYDRGSNRTSWRIIYRGLYVTSGGGSNSSVVTLRNGTRIYATGGDTALMKSTDGGAHWESMVTNAFVDGGMKWFHGRTIAAVDTDPVTLYLGVTHLNANGDPGGIYKSADDGETWTRLNNGLPTRLPKSGITSACHQIVLDPDYVNNRTLYATFQAFGVFKSTDAGQTWNAINSGLESYIDTTYSTSVLTDPGIAVDPENNQNIFLACRYPANILFISIDAGRSWKKMSYSPSFGPNLSSPTIAGSGANRKLFIPCQQGVLAASIESLVAWAKSWAYVLWQTSFSLVRDASPSIGSAGQWTWKMPLSQVVADPRNPDRLFVVTSSWGDSVRDDQQGVYVSEDCGGKWAKLFEVPFFAHNVNVSDDGRYLLMHANGADIWRFDLLAYKPQLAPIEDQAVATRQKLEFTVSGYDPNNEPLSYSASGLPKGAGFNTVTRTFSWTPDRTQTGDYPVTFRVSDGKLSDSRTVNIEAYSNNRPPELAPIGNKFVDKGQKLQFTISATDPDNDPLTYSATGLPSGATFYAPTRTFTWTPPSSQTSSSLVTFTVSDGIESDSETVTIGVTDVTPPVGTVKINNDAAYACSSVVTLNLSATDSGSGMGPGALMRFSNDGVNWSEPQPYTTETSWGLLPGEGSRTVQAMFMDVMGNWSAVASDSVIVDTTKPTGSVTINDGAQQATSTRVTLSLQASDAGSGMASGCQMRFSNDGVSWSDPESYLTTKAWTLPAVNGVRTVYAMFKDAAGNWSDAFSDDIVLQVPGNSAPQTVGVVPSYTSATVGQAATISATYSDQDGSEDIAAAYILVSSGSQSKIYCPYFRYDQTTNLLYLRDNFDTSWVGGFPPGSLNTVINSTVSLNCAKTTVSRSGTDLIINWNFTFKSATTSTQGVYLYATDRMGESDGWTLKGTCRAK